MACNPACKKLRGLSSKMLNRVKTQQVFVHVPEIAITGENGAREIEERQLQRTTAFQNRNEQEEPLYELRPRYC